MEQMIAMILKRVLSKNRKQLTILLAIVLFIVAQSPHQAAAKAKINRSLYRGVNVWLQSETKGAVKKIRIRLFQADKQPALYIRHKATGHQPLRLYVFDLDGRCVHEVSVEQRQIVSMNEMEKGKYLFELFSHDLRVDKGYLEIK